MPMLAPALGAAASFLFTTSLGQGILMLGASLLLGAIFKEEEVTPDLSQAQTGTSFEMSRGERVPISGIFGRKATAGHFVHHEEYGTDNEYIKMVFVVGTGVHDGLDGVYIDGQRYELYGSNSDPHGYIVGDSGDFYSGGQPYMWAKFYDGSLSQVADPELVALGSASGRWTSASKLAGHAYVIFTVKYDEDLFGQSVPRALFDVRGLRLYDWRKDDTQPGGSGSHRWDDQSTWEFSENVALCSYNYMRGIWLNGVLVLGVGASAYDVNLAKYTAAANLCDETLSYPTTGVELPRYTVGLEVKDDMDGQTVLRYFEEAMGGYGTDMGGAYAPLPAQQHIPAMTITDDDLQLGYPHTLQTRLAPNLTYTAVQGQFSDPEQGWQPISYGTLKDDAVDAEQGGRRTLPWDLLQVRHIETAQMLGEARRRRDLYVATETAVVRPKFVRLEVGDVTTRVSALFGAIPMQVTSHEELEDGSIRLGLRHWDNAIVPSSFGFLPAPPASGTARPPYVYATTVSGLTVTPVQQTSGGIVKPALRVTWSVLTDPTVDRVIIKFWPSAEPNNVSYLPVEEHSGGKAMLLGLVPNTEYGVAATIATTPARSTIYTSTVLATTGEETVPAVPADGSITPEMLAQELQNERGMLVGAGDGTLAERLNQFEARMAAAEEAMLTDQTTSKSRFSLLKKQNGASLAAIAETRTLITELNAAFAQFQLEVAAQLEQVLAGGLLRIEAQVNEETAEASILFKVRAGTEDTFGEAVFQIGAQADLIGGTADSWVGIMADRMYFLSTAGGVVTQPFAVEADFVKITELRFENLTSVDGQTIVIRGTAGDAFASFGAD